MKLLEALRKGLRFVLLSMGVSSPGAKKPDTLHAPKRSAGKP